MEAAGAGRTRLRPVMLTGAWRWESGCPHGVGLGEGGEQNARWPRVIGGLSMALWRPGSGPGSLQLPPPKPPYQEIVIDMGATSPAAETPTGGPRKNKTKQKMTNPRPRWAPLGSPS